VRMGDESKRARVVGIEPQIVIGKINAALMKDP
jgi:hypothetical protein